jgi:hypothetical protein
MRKSGRNVKYVSNVEYVRGQEITGESLGYVEKDRDPQVFARNLNRLTLMHGLSRRQAAEKVGADYLWYRRAVTRGLSRVSRATKPVLEKLVEEFRLTTVEDLWEPGLIRFEKGGGLVDEPDAHLCLVWRQKEWWPWARKLAHILASGQHD